MKKITLLGVMALLCLYVAAQENAPQPLTVGDALPDITFYNLYNYPSKAARISDFKGKLVILDFWSVWCNSCIKEFPHFEKLQDEFGNKLRFILLTADSPKTVNDATKRISILKSLKLPYGVSDTAFAKLFPHHVFPHSVWINGNGKVIAITGSDQITSENISKAINNAPINLPVKIDVANYNVSRPLLENATATVLSEAGYFGVLTNAIPGLPSTDKKWQDSTTLKLTYINKTVAQLLLIATGLPKNKILLSEQISQRFTQNGRNLLYCYEVTTPVNTPDSLAGAIMLIDILRHFNLKVGNEFRPVRYYSLQVADETLIPFTKGATPVTQIGSGDNPKKLINAPFAAFIGMLNMQASSRPETLSFVDETNCAKNIDLVLPVKDFLNPDELNKALKGYGLVIKEATRSQEFLVINNATFKKN